jgi:hypothetical protein
VNLFGSVTAVAEFVGGGVFPWAKVESVKLFNKLEGFGYVIFGAEFLFAFATFYYLVNIITTMKREGIREFTKNSFHMSDVFTVFMSILALVLYGFRSVIVRDLVKRHSIYISTVSSQSLFAKPVYGLFGQRNMHSTFHFCTRTARKEMNVPLQKKS